MRWLFGKKKKAPCPSEHITVPEHIAGQRKYGPPFYCGTAFCGHSTIAAAVECWQKKCARIKQAGIMAENGQTEQAERLYDLIYPERNPKNWPINRSASEMAEEYLGRVRSERED